MGNGTILPLLEPAVTYDLQDALDDTRVIVDMYYFLHWAVSACKHDIVMYSRYDNAVGMIVHQVRALSHAADTVLLVYDGNSCPGKKKVDDWRQLKSAEVATKLQQLLETCNYVVDKVSANGKQILSYIALIAVSEADQCAWCSRCVVGNDYGSVEGVGPARCLATLQQWNSFSNTSL